MYIKFNLLNLWIETSSTCKLKLLIFLTVYRFEILFKIT